MSDAQTLEATGRLTARRPAPEAWLRVLAPVCLALTILAGAASLAAVVNMPASQSEQLNSTIAANLLAVGMVGLAVAGTVLARQQPRSTIAWLMLDRGSSLAAFAGWLTNWGWIPAHTLSMVMLLRFPTGRLPGPRWRPAEWAVLAGPGSPGTRERQVGLSVGTSPAIPKGNPVTTPRRSLLALVAVCAVLALNGLVLGTLWLVTPGDFSDTVASPAFAYSQRITWALLTVLILLIPAVLRLTGRRGTPPGWVVPLAQGALGMQAATHFIQGFMLPWLEPLAPEVVNLTSGGLMQFTMIAIQVFYLVAMTTVGVTLWRAGHSRPGSVLMILGAVVAPGVGPIGHGIFAIGLLVITVLALRSRTAASNPGLTPVTV